MRRRLESAPKDSWEYQDEIFGTGLESTDAEWDPELIEISTNQRTQSRQVWAEKRIEREMEM